jgi:hypothetical protein
VFPWLPFSPSFRLALSLHAIFLTPTLSVLLLFVFLVSCVHLCILRYRIVFLRQNVRQERAAQGFHCIQVVQLKRCRPRKNHFSSYKRGTISFLPSLPRLLFNRTLMLESL